MHSLPVPMGGARAAHGEAEDVTMPAGWSLPQGTDQTSWRGHCVEAEALIHSSPPSIETTREFLGSPLLRCQSPYLPNGNLLTGKDLTVLGN